MIRYLWAVFLVSLSTAAIAGEIEDTSIGAFELYCIENTDQQSAIPSILKDIGIQPLKDETATTLLRGQIGKAWSINQNLTQMFLSLTDKGVCSVYAVHANPEVITNLIDSKFRSVRVHSENTGSLKEEIFLVTHSSRRGGEDIRFIVRTESNLELAPVVILHALSEAATKEMGMSDLQWP